MVQIKDTGISVSRICLGTMTFGGQVDEAAADRIAGLCLDRGVNFFDTANVYTRGASERILGKVLGARRPEVVIASKAGIRTGEDPLDAGLSRAAILRAVDRSLERLGTDYLDFYYLHAPDYTVPLEESLAAMEDLVRQGKVRAAAASNYASWQVCRMHWIAERNGYSPVRLSQPMYNLLARGIEQEYLPMCRESGVANFVYNPLAGGLLTGKHGGGEPEAGTRFEGNKLYQDRYWHERNFEAVRALGAVARDAGRTLVSLALNWILHHTPVEGIVLGVSRIGQLEQNLAAAEEGPLPEGAPARCDEVWRMIRGAAPQYNR